MAVFLNPFSYKSDNISVFIRNSTSTFFFQIKLKRKQVRKNIRCGFVIIEKENCFSTNAGRRQLTRPNESKWVQPEKTYLLTCAPKLIRVFVLQVRKLCIFGYPKCDQWRFWSACANAQADLNPRWSHMFKGTFSDVYALRYYLDALIGLTLIKWIINGIVVLWNCHFGNHDMKF